MSNLCFCGAAVQSFVMATQRSQPDSKLPFRARVRVLLRYCIVLFYFFFGGFFLRARERWDVGFVYESWGLVMNMVLCFLLFLYKKDLSNAQQPHWNYEVGNQTIIKNSNCMKIQRSN